MSRVQQGIIFLVVAVLAVAAGVVVHVRTRPQAAPEPAPPATAAGLMAAKLPDLEGRDQAFDQWRGKVLVINFWATWCVPCRKEIPEFIQAQAQYGPQGLQIVGVAIDQKEKVKPYAAEIGINYPVLIGDQDGIELARIAGNTLGALPFTVVLDRNGNAISNRLGTLDRDKLDLLIRPLL